MNTLVETKGAQLARFQDALEAARAKGPEAYAALFDAPPEGLSVHEIDTGKVFVRVSPAHERILGYPPQSLAGRPASSFAILKEVAEMAMSRRLAGNGKLEPYVSAFVKADGAAVTLLQLDRHLLGPDGRVTGIRTVVTLMPAPPPTGSWSRASLTAG